MMTVATGIGLGRGARMRNYGLLAFVLTSSTLVPAGLHYLDAGHDQVVAFAAPSSRTFRLGGATIEAKLEHPLVDPGESLVIELRASGATGKELAVGVLIYGSAADEFARVLPPPDTVANETVTLAIGRDGTGEARLEVPLRGSESPFNARPFNGYQVLVSSPNATATLARLRRELVEGPGNGVDLVSYNASGERFIKFFRRYAEPRGDDAKLFGKGAIARLDAYTRTINQAIAIEAPARAPIGKPFEVSVAVTNPMSEPLAGLEVVLETPAGVVDPTQRAPALVMQDHDDVAIAPGETKRVRFRVAPGQPGMLGLYARVRCRNCNGVEALTMAGTFDAIEIVR